MGRSNLRKKIIKKIENGKNNRKVKRKVKKEVCMKAKERQMGTGRQKKEMPGSKILSCSVFFVVTASTSFQFEADLGSQILLVFSCFI